MTVTLKNGERLDVEILHPPFAAYGDRAGEFCWWSDVRNDLLAGRLDAWLSTPCFVGEIDGELAGSMSLYAPRQRPEVGLVEFVRTAEGHRRKGVASALLGALIAHFRERGGLALYLCTNNPHAGALYEKHGFWYTVGDGMRYLAPGAEDFDGEHLAFCGAARVREATWADLPPAAALYNHPEPDWYIKDYLGECFRRTRFEVHFARLMKRVENGRGALLALENPRQRVVGLAACQRRNTFYEQHVATLSFRVHPEYFSQATGLLEAMASRARELSISLLHSHVADGDDDQAARLREAGFTEAAQLRGGLRDGATETDLLIYALHLEGVSGAARDRETFYGERHPWQQARVERAEREETDG